MSKAWVIYGIGFLTCIVACVVLFGWITGTQELRQVFPGGPTMKATTAVAFLCSGLLLITIHRYRHHLSDFSLIITPFLALLIVLIMSTLLLSAFFGFTTGLEGAFNTLTLDEIYSSDPPRSSFGTIAAFMFIATLSLAFLVHLSWQRWILSSLAGVILLIGVVAIVGFATGQPLLYYAYPSVEHGMAISTAVLFILLAIGFFIESILPAKNTSLCVFLHA